MNLQFQDSIFKLFRGSIEKIISILILTSLFSAACSIPNLEKPECIESREIVKQFYSFHFGNDLKPDDQSLKQREIFLSRRLFDELKKQTVSREDYFTQTEDYPKAFRVGGCEVISENKTVFEVLLFWKNETRSDQVEIKVETVKENNNWVIDKVERKK